MVEMGECLQQTEGSLSSLSKPGAHVHATSPIAPTSASHGPTGQDPRAPSLGLLLTLVEMPGRVSEFSFSIKIPLVPSEVPPRISHPSMLLAAFFLNMLVYPEILVSELITVFFQKQS